MFMMFDRNVIDYRFELGFAGIHLDQKDQTL